MPDHRLRRTPRVEHVGSLLRPGRLLEARRRFSVGELDAEALRIIEDETILSALRAQESIGLDVVGDGEFRRTDFRAGFAAAVSGLREEEYDGTWHGPSGPLAVRSRRWRVVGSVTRTGSIAVGEARFLAEHARVPFKVTLPAPGYLADRLQSADAGSPYADRGELAQTLLETMRTEIGELIAFGVPHIQLDNPGYATFLDGAARARMASQGRDPDAAFCQMLACDCALLESVPRGSATLSLHVCRGNNASQWLHAGGYAPIAEQLFHSLPVDRLLLEFDDERSGGLDVLRFVPRGRIAVLGLISTKAAALESPDDLMRRLDEAASFLDPEQLAISPQCGFATHAEGANHLTTVDQYRKLSVAVETAQRWFGAG